MTPTTALELSAVLAGARRDRAEADAAEARVLLAAATWAEAHEVPADDGATWGDAPVPLAGEGAPAVGEFCIAELAAALSVSTDAGRALIGHALEIRHRLPRLWDAVQSGAVPTWRARRVAERTVLLTAEAAAFVDVHVAPFASRIGPAALERLVDEAIGRFMPELVVERTERAADGRHVTIDHRQVSFAGTSSVMAELDLADALDLEDAVRRGAQQLADLGNEQSLDVRRSQALGCLARGEQCLPLPATRQVVLHVHLEPEAPVARVEEGGHRWVSVDQVRAWCGAPATTQVTVKPVIDLSERLTCTGHDPSDRLRDQVVARDRTCAFPWCERLARRCDLDHVDPFDAGGPTSSDNLAPLCRRHHRLKTFGAWTYVVVEAGTYLWAAPHGLSFLRDGSGTRCLTPRPVEPPGG